MTTDTLRKTVAMVLLVLGPVTGIIRPAQAEGPLAGYNAAIGESSISGISSGAFMAVQFATAWSSVVKGVGIVAGGPYWCAKADSAWGYWSSVGNATGPCVKGPLGDLNALFAKAEAKAASGEIDSLQFVSRQKVYIFHGYNDVIVARAATDAAAAFYRRYLGEANRGNLYYQTAVGAGHSLAVAQDLPKDGVKECNKTESPFIGACSYDQAGVILQHIYGPLNKPGVGPLTGTMKAFDQSIYTKPDGPSWLSLDRTGYVFVPKACENGEACRVHVALHGCKQDFGNVKRAFIDRAGYNAWADANRLIVLYPQTTASSWSPWNSYACWDWWGYISYTDNYVTKAGLQIKAIKAMLDALTSRAVPATSAMPVAAPIALSVIDTSDTSADLVWTPQSGATGYRISRAGAGGQFAVVADVSGPGIADSGLMPKSAYRWRVTALVNGTEGSPSNEVDAVTRAAVACANPGSCPWGN
jgi:poly(3-hydroxybutyrate) depolymerase